MKKLVICCDGTWNSADQHNEGELCPTNVLRFACRVAKRDVNGVPQIVFYDQGVGTGNSLDKLSGGAFGHGLEDNIHDAYRFLLANYEPGDRIFVVGFSRGAYTARSLLGMVRKCGILHQQHVRRYPDAIHLYQNGPGPDEPDCVDFRSRHCIHGHGDGNVEVDFLGVWDTVGSLGIPLRGLRSLTRSRYQFHDTELSGMVKRACHALAIDEYRPPFEPTLWDAIRKEGQTVEQVWFCGAHSDVGGGYARDRGPGHSADTPAWLPMLADISLGWMLASAHAAGLDFDAEVAAVNPLPGDPLARIHNSKTGIYRLSSVHRRPMGVRRKDGRYTEERDPTQSLHESVLARWDADPAYRPAQLREYFRRTGDSRAGS